MDLDVPLENSKLVVKDDFRLKAGLPTLKMCLENAQEVIVMGHLGRPEGKVVSELSVEPIYDWFVKQGLSFHLGGGRLKLLENLRFEGGEESCSLEYAKELANFGEVFVNEAFAAHHPASSTTILPTLLPHAVGLRFNEEVKKLTEVRENPKRPLVVVLGGAKIEDKLPVVEAMAKVADWVLVGGKIVDQILKIKDQKLNNNTRVGRLTEDGLDITEETLREWEGIIKNAKMIVWNGPVGKVQSLKFKVQSWEEMGSERGTYQLAKMILESGAESIVGGGDTVGFLTDAGFRDEFGFVSTGGGAMLQFLEKGTLPTIEAL